MKSSVVMAFRSNTLLRTALAFLSFILISSHAIAAPAPVTYESYWTWKDIFELSACQQNGPFQSTPEAVQQQLDQCLTAYYASIGFSYVPAGWVYDTTWYGQYENACTWDNGLRQGCDQNVINAYCPNGGSVATEGGLSFPGYCLMPTPPPRNSGCLLCGLSGIFLGNPINVGAGSKYEQVTDYRSGGAFPLVFSRAYNSTVAGQSNEGMGNGWTTNIGGHLQIDKREQLIVCQEPNSPFNYYVCPIRTGDITPIEVTVWSADGAQVMFNYPSNSAPDGTALNTEQVSAGKLFFVGTLPAPAAGSGFKYLRTDGYIEYFTSAGALVAVQNPGGLRQTYQYNANGQLTSVTDPFSRQLVFTYDSSGRIQTLTTPTGVFTYGYDTSGNLASVQNPDNSTIQYKYENSSFPNSLTGIIDENGNRYATWGYDSSGRANSSQHAGGVDSFSAVYTVNAAGQISSTQATEPTGLVRTLTFTTVNFMNLLTGVSAPCTECGDKTKSLTYDANGYVASKTDFDGNVTQYVHDAFGNETSRTEAYGTQDARTITTQWNTGLNQPALITEPGRTSGYTYDGVGHVLTKSVTDTATNAVRTTTYTYYSTGAAVGLLETVTDPLNHVTSYSYDSQGDLASVTNAANQQTQITQYDANGMPLTIVDPNGVTTTLTYDARQRLKTRTVAGAQTQFAYDLVGNLTQVTLPTGSYLKYSYDAAHRLTGITDSLGDSIAYTLDNLGNRTGENTYDPSNVLKKTLSRTYNNLNQLLTTVGGASQTTTYTDDQVGNTTFIKDPLTNVTGQSFDALNRLATVVDPESGNTTYNYDPLDRVQDVTDPKGLNTHYSYDAFGDVTQQQSPDTGTTSYTYDLDGNRLTKTDARSITATYNYDALNRLTNISYPDASRNVSYSYDQGAYGIGHLTGISDPTGTTTYSYDAHGNTTQKAVTMGSHTFTVGYGYDSADNLTGMTYPSGLQVSYVRDTAERVTAVNANSSPIVSGITYEPFGPLTGFTYGNGLTETRSYDQDYRLTGISVPGVLGWTFQDNADDDLTSITDSITSSNSQTLGYDTLNRLASAAGAYGSQSYVYDLDGNRSQETLGGTVTNLGYDTASNKLLTVGSQSHGYDAVGNLLSDGSHTYNYDAANRLTGYDAVGTAYLYNGLGQRAVKFPTDTGSPTVAITAPASGNVSGTVTVSASADDEFGITSVQFRLDGANLGSAVTTAPYQVSWNTTTANPGAHTLTAIATDGAGHTATSAAVNVTVPDTTPPTVSLTAPASGADVSGTITVSANASDDVTVASVQFQLDGANLGTPVTTAPYSVSWNTTTATGGSHTLTAIAKDGAGNTATSAAVSVTVDNTPPAVAITAPAAGNVSGTVTLTASASASYNVAVTSVQFQLDGANLGSPLTAAPYTTTWNTINAVGNHTLTAVATDAAGNTATSAAVSVTVLDVTPPTVSMTAPATGADLAGTVTVSANASDNVAVTSVQFQLDGTNLGAAVTAAPYTISWNTTTATGGSHTLTAIASDAAGNTATSAAVSVTVDNTPPTVSLTAPANGADLAGTVAVSANASDNVAVASVQFQLDGANLGAAVTTAPYSVSWNTTTATGGSHTLTAIAKDGAGNTTTSTAVSVAVDNTPPTVSLTAPANGADLAGTVAVSANASDNVAVASVQFQLDGANLGAAVTTAPYSVSWNTTTATGGSHTLTAIAKDGAGNSTTSTSVSVTVDNTPPTVSLIAPANGADLAGTVAVSANASDNIAVASVQFQLDGANLGAPVTAAPYSVSWSTTTATGGSHTLTAIAKDGAGNTTTSTSVTVTVDNTPPTVSLTAPANSSYLRGTVNVNASANASNGVGIASVQFQLDGTNLGAAVTAAPYTVSWNTTTATGGSHILTAIAKDGAGNTTTSAAVSVTVDNTPPTVNITSPANGATVSGTITVSANASDNVGVASVQFQLDGSNLGSPVSASPYQVSWNTTTATGGSHTLTAIAKDGAGNTTTSTAVNVTVGNGVVLTPSSGLNYGNVNRGSSSTLSATLNNNGTVTIHVFPFSTSNSVFSITRTLCGADLDPGGPCEVFVKFTPTADSSYSGTLKVVTTAGSLSINLTGTGVH